jgi:3-hydroxyisobutyrate dehydrogenase-like beta-hydroxyacid dehydrogenase
MPRVAVLHPGEMGAAVGATLVESGTKVVWRPEGRSAATRRRAEAAGLVEAGDLHDCDVVLSVCPPGAAVEVARLVSGFLGVYGLFTNEGVVVAGSRRPRAGFWRCSG